MDTDMHIYEISNIYFTRICDFFQKCANFGASQNVTNRYNCTI